MASSEHYFYVLECADQTFYAGYTTDPVRRLQQHNNGTGAKYTRLAKRQPMRMIHLEKFSEKSPAMQAEYAFKQLTRSQKRGYLANHKSEVFPNNKRPENHS
ncbi:GIY-YIG nuclease family protein [Vagococcus zengguangii]|uniref:GIY-YIG nuclease family protein n=1 Tax=Vagococcus zengguangii TaxID=2571750 RepID=A0A4D7CXQ5_9ENTE|nr:GIY-YIG nuclease family protein [Vagococcus zengguangii]QCI87237.1 GIY-YIG nuclease family protein [Vagococcus zengguangii]TLG80741.1 GIY-YIG nuclease family protein [Vagococcus zengguangii]